MYIEWKCMHLDVASIHILPAIRWQVYLCQPCWLFEFGIVIRGKLWAQNSQLVNFQSPTWMERTIILVLFLLGKVKMSASHGAFPELRGHSPLVRPSSCYQINICLTICLSNLASCSSRYDGLLNKRHSNNGFYGGVKKTPRLLEV